MSETTEYMPGQWVYRWWFTFPNDPDQQPLKVVRVNRKTLTVTTAYGSVFRLPYNEVAGHADKELADDAERLLKMTQKENS